MRMLDDLKPLLDDIERRNDWEHEFITTLLFRKETNPNYRLTNKQFDTLCKIHEKYIYNR